MPDAEEQMSVRRLTAARELRAMAHPLRVRLLEALFVHGEQTASELAERVGESPANVSWHMRKLAEHGYVEQDTSGPGRRRPWHVAPTSMSHSYDDTPTTAQAAQALSDVMLARDLEAYDAHRRGRPGLPKEWRQASFLLRSLLWMTAEELAELEADVYELIKQRLPTQIERFNDHSKRPEGARPVRFLAWGHPSSEQ